MDDYCDGYDDDDDDVDDEMDVVIYYLVGILWYVVFDGRVGAGCGGAVYDKYH